MPALGLASPAGAEPLQGSDTESTQVTVTTGADTSISCVLTGTTQFFWNDETDETRIEATTEWSGGDECRSKLQDIYAVVLYKDAEGTTRSQHAVGLGGTGTAGSKQILVVNVPGLPTAIQGFHSVDYRISNGVSNGVTQASAETQPK